MPRKTPVPFGKRPTEKDPHQEHLAGGLLHSVRAGRCDSSRLLAQALERSQPMLPVAPGLAERRSHDYYRHGTTSLFAALNVATGPVTDQCYQKHTNQEFPKFLKRVAAEYPEGNLRIVVDNYRTHQHKNVTKWPTHPKNKRITLHFTPTGCSWMNLVEVFFSIITRKAIRRGSFTSVKKGTSVTRY